MRSTIKAFDLIGREIKLRSSVDILRQHINEDGDNVIDFENIDFISRSVADELCELKEHSHASIEYVGMGDMVAQMLRIVSNGRNKERKHEETNDNIVRIATMNELTAYLSSM